MKSLTSSVVYRFFPGEPISTKSGITGITPLFALGSLCDVVSGEDEAEPCGFTFACRSGSVLLK